MERFTSRRARRFSAGLLTMAALVLGAPAAVSAYPPQPPGPGEPGLDLDGFAPVCQSDAPYIQYSIVPVGFEPTGPATMVFRDVNGTTIDTLQVSDLSGRVVYPGASVGADGTATDWPGWKQEGGLWVLDDTDAVLRQGLAITVQLGTADATTAVSYPGAGTPCADPSGVDSAGPGTGSLPQTGSGVSQTLTIAGVALLAGIALLGVSALTRRRRPATPGVD